MNNIVMISGKQGSGKTTLSKQLIQLRADANLPTFNIKFADVLYEMHDKIWEILNNYEIYNKEKKSGPLLQYLGTDFGRNTLGENVWVRIAQLKVDRLIASQPDILIVIDDCRFLNELQAFPDAYKVRLECTAEVRKQRCEMWRNNENHPSEVSLDDRLKDFNQIYLTEFMSTDEIARDLLNRIS